VGERPRRDPQADKLARRAAELVGPHTAMSLAHIKLRISERFRQAKDEWHANPAHHGTMEIPPPPPKKSMLDRARSSTARVAAQIRAGHWRSAVYLKRIRKRDDDKCWFCKDHDRVTHKMTRPHVLLNCRNPRLVTARAEAWEGRNPWSVRRLLADPRWEKRFVRFLELSGVGRTVADGTDEESAYAARRIRGLRGKRRKKRRIGYPPGGRLNCFRRFSTCSFLMSSFCRGCSCPRRFAHSAPVEVGGCRRIEGSFPLFALL
jgi:hypothetical protein